MRTIDIIQVHKFQKVFPKSIYTTEERNKFLTLPKMVESDAGFIEDEALFLPSSYRSVLDLEKTSLILLNDIFDETTFSRSNHQELIKLVPNWFANQLIKKEPKIYGFNQLTARITYDFFVLKKLSNDAYDISVDFNLYETSKGKVNRDAHKIGSINNKNKLQYSVNNCSDISGSSRDQRVFYEAVYVFEYLGQAKRIDFLPLNMVKKVKQVTSNITKEVDERKMFR